MKKLIPFLLLLSLASGLLAFQSQPGPAQAATGGNKVYVPAVFGPPPTSTPLPTSTPVPPGTALPPGNPGPPRINAPYFSDSDVISTRFSEMGIFWFGKVTPNDDYTDVRIAYNDTELVVYTTTYDRIIAYNPTSIGSDLVQWDTAALALQTSESGPAGPGSNAFRFLVEVRWFEPQNSPNYQAVYRGNGSGWTAASVPFTNKFGYMGTVPGDNLEDKGWAITFHIPYSSLGVSKPASGARWRMHLDVYNRNSQAGPPLAPSVWPAASSPTDTSHWGLLNFGIPTYTPPPAKNSKVLTLRQRLNGATVTDAAVGGGAICGGQVPNMQYYDYWGSLNYAGAQDFNIQNQGLIADWPCYSKVYITIPISAIPAGKLIRSAKLSLSEFGGSDPTFAPKSYIQVMSAASDWSEATLNWNNAPPAQENYAATWVNVFAGPIVWATIPRYDWDVSRALADAYARGGPLRLVLYSADAGFGDGMHTGKYFVSSDTGDWNAANRPTLTVEYVDP